MVGLRLAVRRGRARELTYRPRAVGRYFGVCAREVRRDPEREQLARAQGGLPAGCDLAPQVLHSAGGRGVAGEPGLYGLCCDPVDMAS